MPLPIDALHVSKVVFPRPVWRYMLLFQSWSQLQSWMLFVIAANIVINFLLAFSETRVVPVEGVLIGTVLGSLCSVIMVLPTEFGLSSCSNHLSSSLTSELQGLGYVLLDSQKDIVIYRQNLPRFLRWNEGNVVIERSGDRLIVKGPLMIVKKTRHFLLRRVIA